MLIQFSVENFMSIKEKVIFSMLASSDKEIQENTIKGIKENYLKSAVIYGANASGKSNLFKAINCIIQMMRMSNNMQPGMELPIVPFKFDKEFQGKPSSFELIMIIENIKYVYGFVADYERIYEEYLYYYPNGKETEIFERVEVNKYHYTTTENSLKDLISKNIENKFFLATATTWNYKKTKPVYDFITNGINVFFDYEPLKPVAFSQYQNDSTGELKEFSLDILKEAGINISGFNINEIELSDKQLMAFPPEVRNLLPKGTKSFHVITSHNITDKNGKIQRYDLNLEDESLGTQNMFILNPFLLHVLKNGQMLVVDELDKSLHPSLVKYIVKIFNSEKYNKNGAQLIFNTHDTNLLNLNIFRRDQVWFTEKDYEVGATDLYPLDDFPVRKTENIEKGYLNGKYGAIPFVGLGEKLWPEDQ